MFTNKKMWSLYNDTTLKRTKQFMQFVTLHSMVVENHQIFLSKFQTKSVEFFVMPKLKWKRKRWSLFVIISNSTKKIISIDILWVVSTFVSIYHRIAFQINISNSWCWRTYWTQNSLFWNGEVYRHLVQIQLSSRFCLGSWNFSRRFSFT